MSVTSTATLNVNSTQAQQSLAKVQKQVDTLGNSFSKLRNIVGGLAIGAMITNMFRAADAITDLSDATGLAVSSIVALRQAFSQSGGDAEGAEQAILKLYQSIEDAAGGNDKLIESFQKVGVSLQDLGTLSEEEITNKVINGLGQLGNSSEAVSIKMDLLGKKARSVDFTSVANQFDTLKQSAKDAEPGLVAAGKVFDNLNKFNGEFGAALGKEFSGLLTTLEKLTSNTESLAKSLAELVKIITILGTAFLIFTKVLPAIRTMGDALQATTKTAGFFGKQIQYIFANLRALPKNLAAAVLGLFGLKDALASTAARAGGIASLGFALLNVLRILLRFAGVVGVIIGVAQALNFLIKTITGFDVLDWLAEKLSYVGTKFKELMAYLGIDYFKPAAEGAKELGNELDKNAQKTDKNIDRTANNTKENEKYLLSIREITKAFAEQNTERLKSLANDIKYLSMTEEQIALDKNRDEIHKEFIKTLDELAKKRAEAMADPSQGASVAAQIDAEIKKVQESATTTQIESAKKIKEYYKVSAAIKEQKAQLEDLGRAFTQANALQELEEELSLIGLTGDELERQRTILESQRVLREQLQGLAKQLLELDIERSRMGEDAYNKERQRIIQQMKDAQEIADAKINAKERELAKIAELENSYTEGVKKAVKDIADSYKPINVAQDAVKKGWGAIENAVDTFVETGKFKFGDFARSVIADLAKIIAKAAILQGIKAALGAFGFSLPGLASGGPAEAGQPYIVGEKGPELFVPKGSGTVIPNNKLGGANGTATNAASGPITNNYNTYNINALDAKSVAQLFAENRKAIFGANKMAEREMSYAGAR